MLAAAFDALTARMILEGVQNVSWRSWGPSPEFVAPGWVLLVVDDEVHGCIWTVFEPPKPVTNPATGEVECPGPWAWRFSKPQRLDEAFPWPAVPQVMLGLAIVPDRILDDLEALLGIVEEGRTYSGDLECYKVEPADLTPPWEAPDEFAF